MLLGGLAGLLAGMFGLGGGIILVPILLLFFSWQHFPAEFVPIMAVATSLATIIPTAISSVQAHHRLGSLDWVSAKQLVPAIIIGAFVGAWMADKMPGIWLKILFAGYLIVVAMQMAWRWRPDPGKGQPSSPLLFGSGVVIGTLASMLGIGGGTLTVPLLVKFSYPMRTAVAVSSFCGLPIALAGTVGYGWLGWDQTGLPSGSFGYVYLPAFVGITLASIMTAPIGAKLSHQLPAETLKRAFAGLLLLIGLKILYGSLAN
ncbi:MAG TPA: sulfite exporter TauE/SafE family protein [Methylothermaceae bacterium]|nr:sulfite exporter TauE/SafE family protein [Methylothermaceae bacterium]